MADLTPNCPVAPQPDYCCPVAEQPDLAAAVARFRRLDALPPLVVKLGGSAMESPAATRSCLSSAVVLQSLGAQLVLVHGGGKPIDRAMSEGGLTPKKIAGRRYTDAAALAIVVRVLRDEINRQIVAQLRELGGVATGLDTVLMGERLQLPGPDGNPLDLGLVGFVTSVDTARIEEEFNRGCIPVLPSLCRDAAGGWLNVNADTAAAAVAGAMHAAQAIFLTDTPGVLRDRHDPESLLSSLTASECRELIAAGVIEGGMIPKVEACLDALEAGARSAVILDGRVPYSLLSLLVADSHSGTVIRR